MGASHSLPWLAVWLSHTGTIRGTFSADALPTDGTPDATGFYVAWFGGNGLLLEEGGATGTALTAYRWSVRGTNADGSTFSAHFNGNAVFASTGPPKLDLFHENVTCS